MRRIFKTLLYIFSGALAYLVLFQLFYNWMRYGSPLPVAFPELISSMSVNYVPIVILLTVNYMIIFRLRLRLKTWLKFVADLSLSMIALVSLNSLFRYFTGMGVEYAGTVFSNFLMIIGLEYLYYEKMSRASMQKQALAQQEMLRYQYEALKAQINPHFLFNSLNILYSFISVDEEKSKEYLLNLSRIYRYILNQNDRTEVSLSEELSFLRSYIDVLTIRYRENFSVSLMEEEGCGSRMLVPYTLQLLLENVTKHNVISSSMPMQVDIQISSDGVVMANTYHPRKTESTTHIGTTYLSRLYESYGRKFTFGVEGERYVARFPFID